jgi:hypothetical protein
MVWFTLHDWGEKTMRLNELFKESGYNHGHADPRAPQLGSDEKRERKHAELQHELGHETNNIAIAINGKTWKVVPCRGTADSREEREYLQHMKNWAEKKSSSSGKKWSVHLTGAPVSEDITEGGAQQAAIAIAKQKSGKYDKDGKRLKETATAGGTSSANIATVVNPDYANNANKKSVKSVNALDQDEVSLFGTPMETVKSASGKKAAIIKRR